MYNHRHHRQHHRQHRHRQAVHDIHGAPTQAVQRQSEEMHTRTGTIVRASACAVQVGGGSRVSPLPDCTWPKAHVCERPQRQQHRRRRVEHRGEACDARGDDHGGPARVVGGAPRGG